MATFLIFSLHSFSSHYHFSCHFHIFCPFFTSPFLSLLHCLLFIFLLSSSPFSPVGHQNSLQAELIHGSVPHHWRAWRHAYKSTHYWETHAHKHAPCHKNDTACILISISKTWLNELSAWTCPLTITHSMQLHMHIALAHQQSAQPSSCRPSQAATCWASSSAHVQETPLPASWQAGGLEVS